MRLVGYVARVVNRNAYGVIAGKPGGKRPLGRRRRRWKDKIKTSLKKTVWEDVYWTYLSQEQHKCRAFMKTVMNLHHP
jgi:hypothetical protein